MRYLVVLLLVFSFGCRTAASTSSTTTADEIRALEQQWNEAIDRRDAAAMERFLAPDYALIIGIRGQPLRVVLREAGSQAWHSTTSAPSASTISA